MTTRTPLRRDLADLKQKVYLLGEKCLETSCLYNTLLITYSNDLEKRLIDLTKEIKKESKDLNDQCFLVLTLQQPLIKDLRFVIGSLQIILSLEKIVDQYLSIIPIISEVSILDKKQKEDFIDMAEKVYELLKTALMLYLSSNLNTIDKIYKSFSEINYLHDLQYKLILKGVAYETGEKAQIKAQLLATIRTLEKIADLILSIAEQSSYIILGKTN